MLAVSRASQTPPMSPNRHRRLSPLHIKGFWLLALIVITESVTLTKAVQLTSTLERLGQERFASSEQQQPSKQQQQQHHHQQAQAAMQECTVSAGATDEGSSNSCPSMPQRSTSQPPVLKRTLGTLGRLKNRFGRGGSDDPNRDCCAEFDACVSHSPSSLQHCALMRGGHMASAAAEAASEAVGVVAKMPYGIPLNGWKVIFQALLTTLNVVCWLVPLRSKHISENKLALSLANAFSGGVFLSLAFGHLIPECVHGFEGTATNHVTPYLLVLSGYLLIFFVEKVAFDAHEILHEMEHAQDHHAHQNNNIVNHKPPPLPPPPVIVGGTTTNGSAGAGGAAASVAVTAATTESSLTEDNNNENGGGGGAAATSGRSALILLGALAVHSILEMAALGLADTFSDSAILTLSIALHQPAESIALLVAFLKSGMPKGEIIRFLSIFSAMGPVGVALGMAVNEFAAPIVDSIMVAIVAGTFVYVGATEVIPEEWEDSEHKWKKFFALMSGIVSILVITQYTMTLA